MKVYKSLCLILVLLMGLSLVSSQESGQPCDFDAYVTEYNKTYAEGSEQYQRHEAIYMYRCEQIQTHNANPDNYRRVINALTDLDHTEQVAARGLNYQINQAQATSRPSVSSSRISSTPPNTFSWVDQGKVSPVQDQGSCGSCVQFAVIAMYESILMIEGHDYGLSEQANLECINHYSEYSQNNGCDGAFVQDGLHILRKVGAVLREDYPYISYYYGDGAGSNTSPGTCAQQDRIYLGNGSYQGLYNMDDSQLKAHLVSQGPVVVAIDASYPFSSYNSGLFTGCPTYTPNSDINHALLLVGYDEDGWILKNSWGTDWGDNGYIRVAFNRNCAIPRYVDNILFDNPINENPEVTMCRQLIYRGKKDSDCPSQPLENESNGISQSLLLLIVGLVGASILVVIVTCLIRKKVCCPQMTSQVENTFQADVVPQRSRERMRPRRRPVPSSQDSSTSQQSSQKQKRYLPPPQARPRGRILPPISQSNMATQVQESDSNASMSMMESSSEASN